MHRWQRNRVNKLNPSNTRRLLIRAVNWVGDAVMTTPALGTIRKYFPQTEITLLANPLVGQLFSPHPSVDRVITFDRKGAHRGITGRFRLAAELKKHAFDAVIILPNSFDSALVPWLAGIPVRLGKNSDGRGLMLTGRYTPDTTLPLCHEVEYYLNLVQHFGMPLQSNRLQLFVTEDEEHASDLRLAEQEIATSDFALGINPGAAFGSAKRWYPERFAEVARQLAAEWSAKIIIFGGPNETDIAGEIYQRLDGNCLNLAGKTNMRELMTLIKRCNFFISNDSGPMHIAAAFAKPLVAIFGSTDHATTSPYAENAVIVRKNVDCAPCKLRECPTDHRCMTEVTADDVVNAARQLYERLKTHSHL